MFLEDITNKIRWMLTLVKFYNFFRIGMVYYIKYYMYNQYLSKLGGSAKDKFMIISHKHKFIFLKTTKTAGTSIEIALSKFCGPDDVITGFASEDEKIRQELGYRGRQNYLSPLWEYNLKDIGRFLVKGRAKRKFYNHITASEVRAHVGQQIWDSYFKFCVERDPWDRVVSLYYYTYKSEPRPKFSEYIDSNVPLSLKHFGFELYTIDGQIAVDKICRFENLAEELEVIRTQLGFPEKLNLPRAKSRFRKNRRSYRDYYSEEEKKKIAELFSDEIGLLGYKF